MKKKAKKLRLSKETVYELDLRYAAGGASFTCPETEFSACLTDCRTCGNTNYISCISCDTQCASCYTTEPGAC